MPIYYKAYFTHIHKQTFPYISYDKPLTQSTSEFVSQLDVGAFTKGGYAAILCTSKSLLQLATGIV
jgi:hypothetical protein